jgi:hypothetical protein
MSVLGMDGTDLDRISKAESADTSSSRNAVATSVSASSTTSSSSPSPSPSPTSPPRRSSPKHVARKPTPSDADPDAATSTGDNHESTRASNNNNNNNNGKHWWGKMVWGKSPRNEGDDDSHYQSLEAPLGDGQYSEPPASTVADSLNPTVEDRLKQDCSFFYQGMEDATPRTSSTNGIQPLSSAVHRVLSSRDGAIYHAKYERLNQDLVLHDAADDDLFLDEYPNGDIVTPRNPMADVQNSSLCYKQNGRLFMRLPRDQMRLVMDQDLEPGIVSVEQWRTTNQEENGGNTMGMMMGMDVPSSKPYPPLRYVMTVPDDLYRRIVAEMSYALAPPCWGFFKCCSNESERADIKLALLIMFFVLLLMFISTLEWHGQ